jgi:hypothetical protein
VGFALFARAKMAKFGLVPKNWFFSSEFVKKPIVRGAKIYYNPSKN